VAGVAVLWAAGIGCLVAALVGKEVTIGSVELPAAAERLTRAGMAVIGVLAIILGIALFAHSGSGQQAPKVSPAAPANASAGNSPVTTSPASSETSPAPAPPATPTAGTVRWQGPIAIPGTVNGGYGIDLDLVPPTGSGSYSVTYGYTEGNSGYGDIDAADIATWPGAKPPSYAQCREWALTNPLFGEPVSPGTQLCLITGEGRTAYLKVIAFDGSTRSVSANAVIWNGLSRAAGHLRTFPSLATAAASVASTTEFFARLD
jgi:hypothetical protein